MSEEEAKETTAELASRDERFRSRLLFITVEKRRKEEGVRKLLINDSWRAEAGTT